jgi:hypothetical protein
MDKMQLTQEDIDALLEVIDPKTKRTVFEERQCKHCGGIHDRACPRVRRMRFSPAGKILEVEFWAKWDDANVIYPEMLGVIDDQPRPV